MSEPQEVISPDLGAKKDGLLAKMAQANPANAPQATAAARRRVPMTQPQRRLETSELPGYHLQWIRGAPDRIQQARAAGFEFVQVGEVSTNAAVLGTEPLDGVSSDLGEIVSITDGSEVVAGQALRLYLMKQPQEYYDEDAALRQADADAVVDALTAGMTGVGQSSGETAEDASLRFVDRSRTKLPELFRRKTSKG